MNIFNGSWHFFARHLLAVSVFVHFSPNTKLPDGTEASSDIAIVAKRVKPDLSGRFRCFAPLEDQVNYSISLCADVPDNKNPASVHLKKEPGHVFLILTKADPAIPGIKITQVFGFYPRRPASCLIFKNVHCLVLDNSRREYDVSITKQLTAVEFREVLDMSQQLAQKRYNLNKYNCYDYALEVFNSLPGIEPLPRTHVKFPFILGRGGSPCGLYRDLVRLKANGSSWAPFIQFGNFRAPVSTKI